MAISGSACPSCGSMDVTVLAQGVEARSAVGNVGTVAEEGHISDGEFRVRVQTPGGARSEGHLTAADLSLKAGGAIEMGRKGEPRVVATLLAKLNQGEAQAELVPGAEDERGEDSILRIQGERRILQVVSVPSAREFWRDASRSTAEMSASVPDAVTWLRETITAKSSKTPPAERSKTILALDAVHAGVLARDEVMDAYHQLHGDPEDEFGFAGIWLVGPTVSTTTRLGRAKDRTWGLEHA